MWETWNEDLTPEEEATLIEKVATEVEKRRLQVPAVLFLEMHRPLMGIASQAMIAFTPFLGPFMGLDRIQGFSRLAKSPTAVESLIRRLETSTEARTD